MLKRISLITLFLSISLCALGQEARTHVMSFNIRYGSANDGDNNWDKRRELVYGVIRDRAPDVVGLQEALRFQIDEMRKALPGYGETGIGRDGGTEGEYSAILYKKSALRVKESGTFWLSDTPEKPSITWGNACIRICTWARFANQTTGASFMVYNTHLDHRSQPSREKSAQLIARRIAERGNTDPFVLTGDFNAGEDNPAILFLKGKAKGPDDKTTPVILVDTFRVLHPDTKIVGTFNGFNGTKSGAKIDFILVAPETKVEKAEIIIDMPGGRCPSDHFPISAEIVFPEKRKQK